MLHFKCFILLIKQMINLSVFMCCKTTRFGSFNNKMSSNSTNQSSDVVFKITKDQIQFNISSSQTSDDVNAESDNVGINECSDQPDSILCILWKNGKLGAAFYKISHQDLYVLQEMDDSSPEFLAVRNLYRAVNPFHAITIGIGTPTSSDLFMKCLIDLSTNQNQGSEDTTESYDTASLPPNLSVLPFKEYSPEICDYKINSLHVACEPEDATDAERAVFLHSLIDFDSKMSVRALGALVKFTEKNWGQLNQDNQELVFLNINQISMSDHVLIEQNTYKGLSIFNARSHDSGFKRGPESNAHEGTSLFRLLSQHCKSKLGYFCLRNILRSPKNNIGELNKRLDFIQFALTPANHGFIEGLQENIRKISDINQILGKVLYMRANSTQWETLFNTIYYTLFLHESCGPFRLTSLLLRELDECITTELYHLQSTINTALDFSQKVKRSRPVIKFGLDAELDAKELKKQDIAKNVTTAAQFAVNLLPNFLNECSVVHIPEMGHLVAVREWAPGCDRFELQEYGFQFMFEVSGLIHYKNAMCVELDKQLGNIHHDILSHENRIIQRLAGYVIKHNKDIREPLKIISLIDCLISIARVCKEKGYVRPSLNSESIQEINGGRHPLLELRNSNVVPNNYYSGGNNTRMKIITGPNNSGKTVYLKQVALVIFMAHVGSYVPAISANIGMVHSIHSGLHIAESAGVNLSAFMLELGQMSQALHNAQSSSFVIMDEFGRGTTHEDGLALLVGALKYFLAPNCCPHVLVSTHFQTVFNHLSNLSLVSTMKMDHVKNTETKELVFLYNVIDGVSNSYALDVALAAGLEPDIVRRAQFFYDAMSQGNFLFEPGQVTVDELDLANINIPDLDV